MSMDLRKLLYHQICDDFEKNYHEIERNLSKYVELLSKINERGDWSVTLSVQGEDVEDPSLISIGLLEKAGVLNGRTKYTERNVYKIFTLTDEGKELIDKIKTEE